MTQDNHRLIRDKLNRYCITLLIYEDKPILKTHQKYSQLKLAYHNILYMKRNNIDEIILSFIKRIFGEHTRFRSILLQNRELIFRRVASNVNNMICS